VTAKPAGTVKLLPHRRLEHAVEHGAGDLTGLRVLQVGGAGRPASRPAASSPSSSTSADRYSDVTAIAAGVTKTTSATLADFDREAALVYDVVRHARQTGRTVVFFSAASDSMYGTLGCPGLVEGPVYPVSAYGRHKLGMEEILARSGVKYLALRLSHIVGEGQRAHQLIPSLGRQILDGSVTVHRNAHRDLLDVEHLLLALDRVLASGVRQEVINVASGVLEPIERIVDSIEERFGVVAERTTVDVPANTCCARSRWPPRARMPPS
jgi:nucleoside-diphosphate-sugar epimerase